MADQSTKTVDGTVDELLLGDGFSIVDSTNPKGDSNAKEEKKPPTVTTEPAKQDEEKVVDSEAKTAVDEVSVKQEANEESIVEADADETKDDSKINGHTDAKSDALLITTEEDLELTVTKKADESENKEATNKEDSTAADKKDDKKERGKKSGDVWVSNITRHVKATDLKRHFSRHGKVMTAKIVTNGKSFFGYILMENAEIANKCVRSLHGTKLDGRKLSVSRQRPDSNRRGPVVKNAKPDAKKIDSKSDAESKSGEKNDKTDKSEKGEKVEKTPEEKKDDYIRVLKRTEDRLKREIEYYKRETARLKRFLLEEQRLRRTEQSKSRTLGRELLDLENKLKDERRKFDREREMYEKNARTDRTRLEADRSMIKRELDEVKKLREYLKRKLEEDQARNLERHNRVRASSPYAYSSKRFREDDKPSSKYMEERTRTPPSPPKLSRKRSPAVGSSSFQMDKDRRYDMDDGFDKDVRHGGSMLTTKPAAPAPPRNIWPSAFHQEVWRMPPGGGNSAPNSGFSSQYPRQDGYGSQGPNKPPGGGYSSNPRDRYGGSSIRKY